MDLQRSPISDYPQSWIKPNSIIRMTRKKKRALDDRLKQESTQSTHKHVDKKPKIIVSQRRNLFKKETANEVTKPSLDIEESSDSTSLEFFNPQFNPSSQATITTLANICQTHEQEKKPVKDDTIWLTKLPVDWSLKTKLRIMSSVNFKWNCTTLKTTEEASGTTGFVRCLNSDDNLRLDTTPSAELHQQCLYWIYPALPWVKMFPRIDVKMVGKSFCARDNTIQKQLYLDWCHSFRSLWQLLRARQCAYFYFCTDTFTVLFRCAGIGGLHEVNAMITPTTTGFRSALLEEGIVFSRPLSKDHGRSPTDSGIGTDSEGSQEIKMSNSQFKRFEEAKSDEEDNEEVPLWLSSMGLEEKSVITGDHLSRKFSNPWLLSTGFPLHIFDKNPVDGIPSMGFRSTGIHAPILKLGNEFNQRKKQMEDTRPESLVYVEGNEVHALYNFLLNSNLCISTTGPVAGIPPTLISSVAFHGGTLRSLQVKHGMVQQEKNKYHSVELCGPILPHVPHSLIKLMSRDHSEIESYKLHLSTLDSTSSFTKLVDLQSDFSQFAVQNLNDCGLHRDLINTLCESGSGQVVNNIVAEKGLFKCS